VKKLLLALFLLLPPTAAPAAGTLESHLFFSPALGENRWVQVYLPEGYDPGGDRQYPVIYFLHGAIGDDHTSYGTTLIPVLDGQIASGAIRPVIVVKPDGGGCGPWGIFTGCNWVNSETLGDWEDYVVEDVVAWAEANFEILPGPDSRAILGHSMGGFGALHAALANPETFAAVASHSGYPYFQDFPVVHQPVVVSEQAGAPPYVWTPSVGTFTAGWFMMSAGFSPNPSNPPYDVDFLLDSAGLIVPSVFDRWLEHDPAALAAVLPPGGEPAIYFDCGTNDEFLLHAFNVSFDAHLTSLGIDHDWRSYTGTHTNRLPLRFQRSLLFFEGVLENPTGFAEAGRTSDPDLRLDRRPNPVSGRGTIDFELSRPGEVSLGIYDVAGRRRVRLVDGLLGEGPHRVTWDARGFPSGVYWIRLETEDASVSRSLVVAR
jgi:S-formylglutathione hydrolase FrmB